MRMEIGCRRSPAGWACRPRRRSQGAASGWFAIHELPAHPAGAQAGAGHRGGGDRFIRRAQEVAEVVARNRPDETVLVWPWAANSQPWMRVLLLTRLSM